MLFSEVYSSYFNAVAAILSLAAENRLTGRALTNAVREHAFDEWIENRNAKFRMRSLEDYEELKKVVSNLDKVNILKVVDHHKLALETSYPLFYRAEAVGCTETVMYKLYRENEIEIDKKIATLMLSAIISDTLLLKSPTTTEDDKLAVEKLAKIAEIVIQVHS